MRSGMGGKVERKQHLDAAFGTCSISQCTDNLWKVC